MRVTFARSIHPSQQMPRNEYASAQLAAVLIDIQNGSCSHSKCLDRLIYLHFTDSERFKRDFAGHLNRILVAAGDKRDINIEKLVNLVIDFAAGKTGTEEDSHYKRHQFALFAIQHLLDRTSVKDKSIRFRGTQILTGVLQCLSSDVEINDALKEAITDKMMERSRDKLPAIRCFAVACLSCFQMSHSVMEEFSRIMDSDTNRDVRKAALSHIRISKHTLPSILRRTRDVKDDIRALAFDILTKKVKPEKLTSRQRCELVNELLKEGTNAQKEVAVLKNWIALRFGNDVMQLCEMFDVESNEEVAEEALKRIFSVTNLASPFVMSSTRLNSSTSFFWRVFCEHLKSQKLEDTLDDALPTLSEYCDILHEAISNSKSVFTLKQLLLGCTLFDIADEVGRARLTSLLGSMLTGAPLEVVTIVTKSLFIVEAEGAECIRLMVESISELMDPLEEDDDIKKLKESLKDLHHRQSKNSSKDVGTSDRIKKIEEALQGNEQKTWLRCCTITEQLLENINKGLHNPMVAGLFHSVILPSVKHKSPEIRNKGLKLLGLFCLFDKEMATSHVPIFIQAVSRDSQDVKITAMKVLFDFLLAYNIDPTVQDSQASPAVQSIQKFLQGYFHSTDEDLRSTCVEGFAKLLLADVVLDSNVLSQLIEQYYHPHTATLPRLRRCLHVFFHTYLRPRANPNARLPLVEVANYLVNLLRLANGKNGSYAEETKLGVKILKLLKADPNGVASLNLCKLLRILRLDGSGHGDVELIRQTTQRVIKDTEDKFIATTLEKLLETIQPTNQAMLSPSGNQKPSEPASPSPPASPYFTESPTREAVERENAPVLAPVSETTAAKVEVKTPVPLRKQRKVSDTEKAAKDFFTQQKRAFAELDVFPLEVEVTPRKARKSIPAAFKTPATTPLPTLLAPNTLPRDNSRSKRVKFESADIAAATPVKDRHKATHAGNSNSNKNSESKRNNTEHASTSKDINRPNTKTNPTITATTTTAAVNKNKNNKRKHEETTAESTTKHKPTITPTKPRFVLSFTGFKGAHETTLLAELQAKAQQHLHMTCHISDGLDSSVTHVVTPAGRKTVKTMTARLAGLWVVEPQWILDSAKANKVLPEFKYPPRLMSLSSSAFHRFLLPFLSYQLPHQMHYDQGCTYGTKQQNCLFDGKSFYFSPDFLNATPRSTIHNCKTFIELARGTQTTDSAMADYVMVPSHEGGGDAAGDFNATYQNSVCLATKQFFALITV